MRWAAAVGGIIWIAGLAGEASAQYGNQFGRQYMGRDPVRVSIEDLVVQGGMYNDTLIITQGRLDYGDIEDQNANVYQIKAADSLRSVRVATFPNVFEDLRFMAGQRVEATGIFFDLSSVLDPQYHPVLRHFPNAVRRDAFGIDQTYFLAITYVEPIVELESDLVPDTEGEEEIEDPDIDASGLMQVDLRALVRDPSQYSEQRIAVLGKFRGNNLYGDLSIQDKRTPRDFVIKAADAAIWVTGRRPRGKDFRLDPRKRRDTGEWLTVIGKTWQYEPTGTYYLRAEKIELAKEPDNEDLQPVRVVHEKEAELGPPPEVTFTLPLEGERDIPLDSEFHVQFSKDMNRDSFNRNVDLLYGDDDGIGNPFPELEVVYDVDTRTLTVKPNRTLDPGKEIHLILYDTIEDDDGQKLVPDPSAAEVEPGAAIVINFRTSSL